MSRPKGFKHSEITRLKIGKANAIANKGKFGELSSHWKGGIKRSHKNSSDRSQRVIFRREIQKLVFERDDYTCQICGDRGIALQVDHIQSWKEYVELRFNMDNCRTLCQKCHYKITFGKPMPLTIKTWGHNLLNKQNEQYI